MVCSKNKKRERETRKTKKRERETRKNEKRERETALLIMMKFQIAVIYLVQTGAFTSAVKRI